MYIRRQHTKKQQHFNLRVELLVFLLQCHLVFFCVCVQSFIVVILYEQQRIILIEFIRFCYQSIFFIVIKISIGKPAQMCCIRL